MLLCGIAVTKRIFQMRTYKELSKLKTFKERFEYLRLDGSIGVDTFGFDRYLNQVFYKSEEWQRVRQQVIVRDNGCDLGIEGLDIYYGLTIHHMNPITVDQILHRDSDILNPDFLVCVSRDTHNAIHYGVEDSSFFDLTSNRSAGDTKLW
jgi:hypothetical protein